MANQGQNAGDFSTPLNDGNWYGAVKTKTYTGAANLGAIGTSTLFTVTGLVRVRLYARCTTNMAGATATNAIGTAISPTGLITTTTMTNLVANELWNDASPDASIEADGNVAVYQVAQNIIETVGTAAISSGVIQYIYLWQPVSPDGQVVAA